MHEEDLGAVKAVQQVAPAIANAIEQIVARLQSGGRLIYLGAGTSGRLGVLDASECPPTFGVPETLVVGLIAGGDRSLRSAQEGAEDRLAAGPEDLQRIDFQVNDTLVGISASGTTPYVLGAIDYARSLGSLTIGLSCNAKSPLSQAAELDITPVVGPEVITGSTRLKAGTATKLVLNMLSTGTMVFLGKTIGNLMSDLRPGSAKLRQRCVQIVRETCGVDAPLARLLLMNHEFDVRQAIESWQARGDAVCIYHLLDDPAWQPLVQSEYYEHDSLRNEGFIHASTFEQVLATAHRHFANATRLWALQIDVTQLQSRWVLEDTSGHGEFPHIYGPINSSSVRRVRELRRDACEKFAWGATLWEQSPGHP